MPRIALSNEERQRIRRYARETRPKPRQIDIIKWFEQQYHRVIRQSTISESLSPRFSFLDTLDSAATEHYRSRAPQWPILDQILWDWYQLINQRGGIVSGDILLQKAREIWPQIPQYAHQEPPTFSAGWLGRFKNRHNIRKFTHFGEASSVSHTDIAEEMRAIQTLCGEFLEEQIFNMDETGLFWKQSPSSGLSSERRPGVKKDKNRITLVCCSNYTGSRRMPLWIIGKARQPRALRSVNLTALGIQYRGNKKAWMVTLLMVEWLQSFYSFVGHEPTLLLLDNFSAHHAGVELAPPPENVRISWLPANSTSVTQPLDQGIISSMKAQYKRRWLQFMVQQYEQDNNPLESMNLYYALRWIAQSWQAVTDTTIYRCFRKAKILDQVSIQLPAEPEINLNHLYTEVQNTGRIQDMMSIQSFLNPIGEDNPPVGSEDPVDMLEIISKHTNTVNDLEEEEEEVEYPQEHEITIPGEKEALEAIRIVQQYQEHQEQATSGEILCLNQIQHKIFAQMAKSQRQETLDRWIT